ncbi:ParM/StbA family protein, partial [Sulfobacillus thermosulfidooxidans]|uniref:ParM/StbA family protein n=1 Tax=Sulfobacillus thermosulfidooxidans TaxID=28034 RepID=UPI00036C0967
MFVAIDAGHGYVKALSSRGGQTLFPALIHPAPEAVELGAFGHLAVTQIDQRAYLIGDAARRLAAPLWSRDKALDDETLRLILVGAASVGASGPVHLATGLPLAWFGAQHRDLKTALRGYGGMVVLPDGTRTRLWFESVLVLPQGVSAAGPVLDAPTYEPGPYLLVDMGYRTTDFILVTKQPDGALTFDPLAAGSLELGMHHVQSAVAEHLTAMHHTVFYPCPGGR